ncbi:MAG: MMPL family transporter [Planctomycetes bacterium]|nr:MMPL family transporter [Planctomycetota bacterium]
MNFYRPLISRGSWPIIAAFLALAGGSIYLIQDLSIEAGTDVLLDQSDPDLAYYHQTRVDWETTDEYVILGCTKNDWFTPDAVELLKAFVQEARNLPFCRNVTAITTVPLLRNKPPTPFGPQPATLAQPGGDLEKARAELVNHTQARGNLISEDGRTTSVLAYLDIPKELEETEPRRNVLLGQPRTPDVRAELQALEPRYRAALQETNRRRLAMVEACRRLVRDWSPKFDERIRLAGLPIININLVEHIRSDLKNFGLLALAFFTLTFALIYRAWRWIALPVVACLLPVALILALMTAAGYRMTVITSNLPVLLFVMTLPYSVYLIERYRERRTLHPAEGAVEASAGAAADIWVPCLYSATTTMAGLASLMTSGIVPVRTFGMMGTIGMTFALGSIFLFLAAAYRRLAVIPVKSAGVRSGILPPLRPLAAIVRRRPAAVVALGAVLLGLSIWGTTKLTAEAKFISYFWRGSEIYDGLEFIDTRMGGITPLEIILSGPPGHFKSPDGLRALDEVESFFETVPETGNLRSFKTLLDEAKKAFPKGAKDELVTGVLLQFAGRKIEWRCTECGDRRVEAAKGSARPAVGTEAPRSCRKCDRETNWRCEALDPGLVGEFCTADFSVSRVLIRIQETAPTLNRKAILDRLRARLSEPDLANLQGRPTGVFVLYSNMLQTLLKGQRNTFLMVVGAIFAMLLLLFRNPLLAILVLFPQILPVMVVLGTMGFLGIPLDMVTTMIAAVAMGVGIDSAIQYTVRYRRELAETRDPRAAIERCHATIGRAILIAVGIMFGGFLGLALSKFVPTVYFGVFTGLAMLMGLLASLTLLPSLFLLLRHPRPPG